MKCIAIVQARMGSTRLPGKSLTEISGQPLLGHVFDRVQSSKSVDQVVLATTTQVEDDTLELFATKKGIITYRGSTCDVLDRYYQAAKQVQGDIIVRITADDPFKDPSVIDIVAKKIIASPALDYVSNTLEPTYPEGLDVEAFRYTALERAWKEATLPSEREHVTPYIWNNPKIFKLENVKYKLDLSKHRWTLDYEEDLKFAREIYKRLYTGSVFGMEEILQILSEDPKLSEVNSGFTRNAGYLKSKNSETLK